MIVVHARIENFLREAGWVGAGAFRAGGSNKDLPSDFKSNRGDGPDPTPGSAHVVLVNLLLRRH